MTIAMTTSHLEIDPSPLATAPAGTRHRALRAVPPIADQRDDVLVAGQRQRFDARARGLGQLLERRPELRGAHAPADLALEGLYAGI